MKFDVNIDKFIQDGQYDYKFDDFGNLIFNSSSLDFNQNYVALPLKNEVYDSDKIEVFNSLNFSEFLPIVVETTNEPIINVDELQTENELLKNQLNELTDKSNTDMTEAERLAFKQVIIELRIKIGEGKTDRDFSSNFPYLPILKPKK